MESDRTTENESEDVSQLSATFVRKHWVSIALVYLLSITCLVLAWITQKEGFTSLAAVVFTIMSLVLINESGEEQGDFMESVGRNLGYTYEGIGSVTSLRGQLFVLGNSGSRSIGNMIVGTTGRFPLRIFNYYFFVGIGTRTSSKHFYTVAEITHSGKLPHLLFLSKNISFSSINTLKPEIKDGISIPLDGKLSKYFALYSEVGTKVDASKLFPPEVTEKLSEYPTVSFELVEDKLYAFQPGMLIKKNDIVLLIKSITAFLPLLDSSTRSLQEVTKND